MENVWNLIRAILCACCRRQWRNRDYTTSLVSGHFSGALSTEPCTRTYFSRAWQRPFRFLMQGSLEIERAASMILLYSYQVFCFFILAPGDIQHLLSGLPPIPVDGVGGPPPDVQDVRCLCLHQPVILRGSQVCVRVCERVRVWVCVFCFLSPCPPSIDLAAPVSLCLHKLYALYSDRRICQNRQLFMLC